MSAEALRASIEAWEKKLEEVDPNNVLTSPDVCPLCRLYYDDGCHGCPVRNKTRLSLCRGTPYLEAYDALEEWLEDSTKRPEFLLAALAEIDFLKSLETPS